MAHYAIVGPWGVATSWYTTSPSSEPTRTPTTHEEYILAIREKVAGRLSGPDHERLLTVKVVYGVGAERGTRGTCYYAAWINGHPTAVEVIEIAARSEESAVQLAGTTVHELAHVLAGWSAGHGRVWASRAAQCGLQHVKAGGQTYAWADFDPALAQAIQSLPQPTDGKPRLNGIDAGLPLTPGGPCRAGQGTRGGKSRGKGSGSRLRKWVCDCGVIARVASDEFQATCQRCGTSFIRGEKANG